jgi:hypothetical protein
MSETLRPSLGQSFIQKYNYWKSQYFIFNFANNEISLFVLDTPLNFTKQGERKVISIPAWTGAEGSKSLSLPTFLDNRHMNVARLRALRTGRFYFTGDIPGIYFC